MMKNNTYSSGYIKEADLIKWIEQEMAAWGEDYDVHQLLKDIEDGSIPRAKIALKPEIPSDDEIFKMVPKRIRQALDMRGLTISQGAVVSGINRATLSNWCHGRGLPNLFSTIVLCHALQVSVDWMLGLTEEVYANEK